MLRSNLLYFLLATFCFGATNAWGQRVRESESVISEAIDKIEQMAEDLEFELVTEEAETILLRDDLYENERRNILFIQARAYVSLEDQLSAETAFRLLMRIDPGFRILEDESPRVVAIFRKVEAEERELRENLMQMTLRSIRAELRIEGGPPEELVGGLPVDFRYQLEDPRRGVERFELNYRKQSDGPFAILPLQLSPEGWVAQIPANLTENEDGVELQYFARTYHESDAILLEKGSPESPFRLDIAPGKIDDHIPLYENVWFWVGTGVGTAALVVITSVLLVENSQVPSSRGGTLD